jgi:hypothetical protein
MTVIENSMSPKPKGGRSLFMSNLAESHPGFYIHHLYQTVAWKVDSIINHPHESRTNYVHK